MRSDKIKSDLIAYYDADAQRRDASEKPPWKLKLREQFTRKVLGENKISLLELGPGPGADSLFFMQNGLSVVAVDLSAEMIERCRAKGIDALEMDFYNITKLNRTFDCVWALNTLLHVPASELEGVLRGIDACLAPNGLFFMGVYGGRDEETYLVTDVAENPRFYSFYALDTLKTALSNVFDILSAEEMDPGGTLRFQAVLMRKQE
ncbi:MAG: class I SAM-dependent methyltransferase [Clostridia bacterium]|nr:class I SAM-dependent methyltransferase [Clostridia bacterium]